MTLRQARSLQEASVGLPGSSFQARSRGLVRVLLIYVGILLFAQSRSSSECLG